MHHLLCKIVGIITAIGAITLGLSAMGHDLLGMIGLAAHAKMIHYLFGISGVISLVLLFTCKDKCCEVKK